MKYRFASHTLFFDSEELTLRAIDNIAPFVERIYVAYSRRPWNYNPQARSSFENTARAEVLGQSKHAGKITVIEGEWGTEEEQRNECVDRATADGYDYLIVQDGDEFYLPEEIEKNLQAIAADPDWYYYKNPWYLFWKSTRYVLVSRLVKTYRDGKAVTREPNSRHTYSMAFALNLRRKARFAAKRKPIELDDYRILPGICHHLSWVYSDEQIQRKLFTWGHTNDAYDRMLWYRVKWLGWTPQVSNLHPLDPQTFTRADCFDGRLPSQIADFDPGVQQYVRPSISDVLRVKAHEVARTVRRPLQATHRSVSRMQRRLRPGHSFLVGN